MNHLRKERMIIEGKLRRWHEDFSAWVVYIPIVRGRVGEAVRGVRYGIRIKEENIQR